MPDHLARGSNLRRQLRLGQSAGFPPAGQDGAQVAALGFG
jgi:hypothetical protein